MAGSQLDQILATVDDTEFGDDDVSFAYIAIRQLSAQWRDIGMALGIGADALEGIAGDNSKGADRLSRVITTWIRQNYDTEKFPLPSWRTLCKALSAVSDNKKFIKDLALKHGGKMPQGVGAPDITPIAPPIAPPPAPEKTLLSAQPKIGDFNLIKYKGEDGSKKKVNIIASASGRWREVAQRLFDDTNYVATLNERNRGDPTQCIREVFTDFLTRRLANDYTRDWNGIIELFDDLDMDALSEQIKEAVLNKGK